MLKTPWGLEPLETALRAQADPEQASAMRAYMLNQFEFLGIRAGPRRDALKGLPKFTGGPDELLALVEALWRLPEREFRYAAVDLLAKQHKRLDLAALPRILQWVQTDAWWDTVDGLAGVVGDVVLKAKSREADAQKVMDAWLVHPNLWVRRVAMLHQLGWREHTDQQRLFRYALTLAGETDFSFAKPLAGPYETTLEPNPMLCGSF